MTSDNGTVVTAMNMHDENATAQAQGVYFKLYITSNHRCKPAVCSRELQLLRRWRLRQQRYMGIEPLFGLDRRCPTQSVVLQQRVQPSLLSFFTCHHVHLLHAAIRIALPVDPSHTHRTGRRYNHYGAMG